MTLFPEFLRKKLRNDAIGSPFSRMPQMRFFLRQQYLAKKAGAVRYDSNSEKRTGKQKCGKDGFMVEKIVQKEEEERPEKENRLLKLPKNIKQIGRGGNNPEIYIEDYAEGYLRRLAGNDYAECRVAVLVGEFIKAEGKRYVFIRGAVEAEDVMKENVVQFTSEIWAEVYEKIKRYFPHYEAVGWFLGGPEFLTEVNDTIRQVHLDWFGGRDRVLYKVDPVEKDTVFYLYDKGELKKWPGYCIYYEKNEEMQDFLVAGGTPSVDAGYREPVLSELGKRVGRREEPETKIPASPVELLEETENPSEKKAVPRRKGGNHYGMGLAAAALLLAVGAFVFYEPGQGALGPAATMTPVPTEGLQTENIGKLVEATGNFTAGTKVPQQTSGLEGSTYEQGFEPMDETPYVPGEGMIGGAKAQATPMAETPVPTVMPEKDNGVLLSDTMQLYIVQSGDTLTGICRSFYGDVSRMEEIKGINQIPDENWIYAGQELYLP